MRPSEVLLSESFTWNKTTKTLVAEASTLGYDTPPECFAISSQRTGKQQAFMSTRADYTPDGSVAGWNYVPVDAAMLGKVSVLIIND